MTNPEFFARSKNGIVVKYDPIHSHASTHFFDTPQIQALVKKIIEGKALEGDVMLFETDTRLPIGNSDLVETDETDDIVYAIRKNRDRYARFTKSRKSQPSSIITIWLKKLGDDSFDLYSAWLGPSTPSFPGSNFATPESKPFWEKHALVWGNQEIQPGTETTICPW